MSDSVYDIDPNNPKFETSREPKYKTMWFSGKLQDDREDWYHYTFYGDYYEFDVAIRFVDAYITSGFDDYYPIIPQDELQNILRIDIREELNTDYSIIFESKIELK